jgi:hypothetical protein
MISEKRVVKFLKRITDNDYNLEDFLKGGLEQDMIIAFSIHGLVWISANDRILLTPSGEQYLHEYALKNVDFKKNNSKVLKKL